MRRPSDQERIARCFGCNATVPVLERRMLWTDDRVFLLAQHESTSVSYGEDEEGTTGRQEHVVGCPGAGSGIAEDLVLPDTPENRAALDLKWAGRPPCSHCNREPYSERNSRGLCDGCNESRERQRGPRRWGRMTRRQGGGRR